MSITKSGNVLNYIKLLPIFIGNVEVASFVHRNRDAFSSEFHDDLRRDLGSQVIKRAISMELGVSADSSSQLMLALDNPMYNDFSAFFSYMNRLKSTKGKHNKKAYNVCQELLNTISSSRTLHGYNYFMYRYFNPENLHLQDVFRRNPGLIRTWTEEASLTLDDNVRIIETGHWYYMAMIGSHFPGSCQRLLGGVGNSIVVVGSMAHGHIKQLAIISKDNKILARVVIRLVNSADGTVILKENRVYGIGDDKFSSYSKALNDFAKERARYHGCTMVEVPGERIREESAPDRMEGDVVNVSITLDSVAPFDYCDSASGLCSSGKLNIPRPMVIFRCDEAVML